MHTVSESIYDIYIDYEEYKPDYTEFDYYDVLGREIMNKTHRAEKRLYNIFDRCKYKDTYYKRVLKTECKDINIAGLYITLSFIETELDHKEIHYVSLRMCTRMFARCMEDSRIPNGTKIRIEDFNWNTQHVKECLKENEEVLNEWLELLDKYVVDYESKDFLRGCELTLYK